MRINGKLRLGRGRGDAAQGHQHCPVTFPCRFQSNISAAQEAIRVDQDRAEDWDLQPHLGGRL